MLKKKAFELKVGQTVADLNWSHEVADEEMAEPRPSFRP
jgi:hypothetical protein